MEIKKGDTVRLKSGGPMMTVQDIGDYSSSGGEEDVVCVWFDGNKPMNEVFHQSVLKIVEDGERRA